LRNNDTGEELSINSLLIEAVGDHEDAGRISVGTSEEVLTFKTDIGSAGYMILINRDATNYVQVGISTGAYMMRILPGQVALLPVEPTLGGIYLIANTATVQLQYKLFEA